MRGRSPQLLTRSADGLQSLAASISRRTGISFAGARRDRLLSVLAAAVEQAGVATAGEYERLLDEEPELIDQLLPQITVGETYFFREPRQLELLRREVLPDLRCRRPPDHVWRVWSAGCATGEEAYTLAIVLDEQGLGDRSRILATDLSPAALEVAAAGTYRQWSLRAVTPDQRASYFQPAPGGFRPHPRFGQRITFRTLNLLHPTPATGDPPRRMDVVFCRNVLIYFTPEAVERVGRLLAASLAPDGWLITGSSDPPLEGCGLETVATPFGFAYRRATGERTEKAPRRPRPASEPSATKPMPPRRRSAPQPVRAEAEPQVGGSVPEALRALERADYTGAAQLASEAVAADRTNRAAHLVLIRSLANAGRLVEALAAADVAVARFPLDVELRYLQAVAFLEVGRPDEAAAAAGTAVYLQPELAVAHLALGRAQAGTGNVAAARRSFRNARQLLRSVPADHPAPLGEGELAGRLATLAETHERLTGAADDTRAAGARTR